MISQLKPRLDENKVRFVAIGLEDIGVEEFVKGEYFTGELYIDPHKDCYKKLGFRRLNIFNLVPNLLGKKSRESLAESKAKKIDGNFAGDGWQNGGALVVQKGGNALLKFKQEGPGDHVDPNEVLKALGIDWTFDVTNNQESAGDVVCTDGACAMPKKEPAKVKCDDDACAFPATTLQDGGCADGTCALPTES